MADVANKDVSTEHGPPGVFMAAGELATRLGAAPLNKHAGCWEHVIDDRWWIAFNGHAHEVECSTGWGVPGFHLYVEYNGWPAGMVSPYDGTFAAGAEANEDAFIEACRRAIEEA